MPYPSIRLGRWVVAVGLVAVTLLGGCRSEIAIQPSDLPGLGNSTGIYADLAPSVARVTLPNGSSGSAVLLDNNYLLTNQHVVEYSPTVRIRFPDGTVIEDAPVASTDMHSDLALIGPVDVEIAGVELAERTPLVAGDRIFLLGYPDEFEAEADVAITEGIVSRLRRMALYDFGFVQVDALIAPGQSGGALVNSRGELAGISGLRFGEGSFGLAIASNDLVPLVDQMLEESDTPEFGSPQTEFSGTVAAEGVRAWLIESVDGTVEITAESDADLYIEVTGVEGGAPRFEDGVIDYFEGDELPAEAYVDDNTSGSEQLFAAVAPGLYVVTVGSFDRAVADISVRSFPAMRSFADVDEPQTAALDEVSLGAFDHPSDVDEWLVELPAGVTVRVIVDSIADAAIVLRDGARAIASADDGVIGALGTSPMIETGIDEAGTYTIEVGRFGSDVSGYALLVEIVDE